LQRKNTSFQEEKGKSPDPGKSDRRRTNEGEATRVEPMRALNFAAGTPQGRLQKLFFICRARRLRENPRKAPGGEERGC